MTEDSGFINLAQFSAPVKNLCWCSWGKRARQLKLKPICLLLEYLQNTPADVLSRVTVQHGCTVAFYLSDVAWVCAVSLWGVLCYLWYIVTCLMEVHCAGNSGCKSIWVAHLNPEQWTPCKGWLDDQPSLSLSNSSRGRVSQRKWVSSSLWQKMVKPGMHPAYSVQLAASGIMLPVLHWQVF